MSKQTKAKGKPAVRSSRMVGRYFATDQELAETLANDIAEEIDCGENRIQLRMAIQYWANECAKQSAARAALESQVAIFRHAKSLMDVALSSNAKADPQPGQRGNSTKGTQ